MNKGNINAVFRRVARLVRYLSGDLCIGSGDAVLCDKPVLVNGYAAVGRAPFNRPAGACVFRLKRYGKLNRAAVEGNRLLSDKAVIDNFGIIALPQRYGNVRYRNEQLK